MGLDVKGDEGRTKACRVGPKVGLQVRGAGTGGRNRHHVRVH